MLRALLFLLVTLGTPAFAQLKWERPWQDFHRSPEDGHLETKFTFQNAGPVAVKIKAVKTSCGCTTARLQKKDFAPGERGELTAKFVFGGRKGAHRKLITVTTDDGQKQELNFVVVIHHALMVSPALVFWKVGQPADAKTVQLSAEAGTTVRVKGVTSSNPRLGAKLETLKPGGQYVVSVTPVDTAQKETAELTVQTDFPPDAPRSYTIHARIK